MYDDSGPATNATSAATSSACPYRSSGTTAFWPTAHSPEAGFRSVSIGCAMYPPIRPTSQSAGTASGTSARAALAQSTSFCTVGAPLTPIAPTISPSTLMGNPPPYAATRASVGMPARSDGSPWMKSKKSCVEMPNRAVYALLCAISMERIGAEWHSVKVQPAYPLELAKSENSGRLGSTFQRLHPQPLYSRVAQQSTSFDIKS